MMKLFIAGAGDRSNEQVKFCHTSKNNGFPHEVIDFRKINSGRIKNDGSYEFQWYDVLNYLNGSKDEHRRSSAAEGTASTN